MRISDVEAITGLSGKSIRLYEAKGLISTKRSDNSYRYFDDETVEKLKCIPVLRRVGISISDIQLWQSKVIGTEEIDVYKRQDFCGTGDGIVDFAYLAELLYEYGFTGDMMLHGIYDEQRFESARLFWERQSRKQNR